MQKIAECCRIITGFRANADCGQCRSDTVPGVDGSAFGPAVYGNAARRTNRFKDRFVRLAAVQRQIRTYRRFRPIIAV